MHASARLMAALYAGPRRVFRRDEVVRLRESRDLSWRAIAKKLGIPTTTTVDADRT